MCSEWDKPVTRARLLEAALDSVRDGVLVVDRAGVIQYANRAACDGFGWERLDGVDLAQLVPHASRDRHRGGFDGFVRSPAAERPVRVQGLHRSGDAIPVSVSVGYSVVTGIVVVTASIGFLANDA
jgi:PAS domain S-box-containing protein